MLTGQDVARIAAEARLDVRTVNAALYERVPRSHATRAAIIDAMDRLGLGCHAKAIEKQWHDVTNGGRST